MSGNQPRPLHSANDVSDPKVTNLDTTAHKHVHIAEQLAALGKQAGVVAADYEALGEHAEADQMLDDEIAKLDEAREEMERAEDLMVEERILLNLRQHPEIVQDLHNRLPALRGPLTTVYDAVRANVPESDAARREVEQLYRALAERLARPIANQQGAIAFLDVLEKYLEQVEVIAQTNATVHVVWVREAKAIASAL